MFLASLCWMTVAGQSSTGRSALLVIDMQEEFTRHSMDSVLADSLIGKINELITAARPMEVIFVKANIRVLSISLRGIRTEPAGHLETDSRLYRKKNDAVFTKNEQSMLSVRELREYLEARNIDHLYLAGIYLGACISGSAADAVERGYHVTVIREAVTAKKPSKSDKLLRKLREQGVEVIGMQEFITLQSGS